MSDEELGEFKIIITSGYPKIIVTTFKDGRSVEAHIEEIKGSHEEGLDRVYIKNLIIQSSPTTTRENNE